MKKTVLKLEKEINAISNNLSKVKNKDHTTMKKIIHNINYLLTKDTTNTLFTNEFNHINETEENQNISENKRIKINKYIRTNDTNIDYALFPLKQDKNNNNDLNSNEPHYSKKSFSSSKIYNNKPISEGKKKNYNEQTYDLYNNTRLMVNDDIKTNNRNNNNNYNIMEYSNNQLLNKGNQMTYSKPRLISEKMNSKNNKINTTTSSTNNNLNINNNNNINNNISIQNERTKNISEADLKYLTLNNKIKQDDKENKNINNELINELYYNYDNQSGNFYYHNNDNKIENPEKRKDFIGPQIKKANNEEHKQQSEKDLLTAKKNKKLIFERKSKRNNTSTLNSNTKIKNNPFDLERYNKNSEPKHNKYNFNYIVNEYDNNDYTNKNT